MEMSINTSAEASQGLLSEVSTEGLEMIGREYLMVMSINISAGANFNVIPILLDM